MELPDQITELGAQVEAGGAITPDPELFETYEVFAAELTNLFVRPWLAADHASRLATDGDYFRVDIGGRSVVIAREAEDKIHAMRNACLHAGYRVCEEEEGRGDHLFCRYHAWDYAIDGRLIDPELRPEEKDRSRFRLPRYAMQIWKGLIFIDPSLAAPNAPEAKPIAAEAPDLADAAVVSRKRFQTTWNWKHLRHFLWGSPELVFAGGHETAAEFGPLSLLLTRNGDAALIRLIPRYAGHSDFELVRIAQPGHKPAEGGDEAVIEEALRQQGDKIAGLPGGGLDRDFYTWYWAAMKPADAA